MCGICGQISFRDAISDTTIIEMVNGIMHRGPDDHGLWRSEDGLCVLGHARLSIIDLSPAGHQPMIDNETGNAIVFNGEIYNFQELRKELEKTGYLFHSQTDTEVILALYRQYGINCLRYLRGMFAFTLWDQSRRQLFLARDRVGKKPLNYALTPDGLVFCSEIYPLAKHLSVSREMDMEALHLYLQLQSIPAPWTIYRQIRKLAPAHYAIFDRNGLRVECYWDVDYRSKARISEEDALDGLEEKLTEAVRLRMVADVPLGALLSGGVDSSLVIAIMAKLSQEPVKTFSIGFQETDFNELPYALEVAEICNTSHYPEILEEKVEGLFPILARHYGEPFSDSSAVPSFLVCETARKHVTVAMNGDGGDELLGGYERYSLPASAIRASKFMGNWIGADHLCDTLPHLAAARSIFQRAHRKFILQYAYPELRSMIMYSRNWNDIDRKNLIEQNGQSGVLRTWRKDWLEKSRNHADNCIDRMLWMDNRTYLPGDLLVKMDIASMHCGLETRSPFLDHEVIEYCAALPVEYKVKNLVGKYLLKSLGEKYFPKVFVHRPKRGFGIPLAKWLRGPLRPVLEDILHDRQVMEPLKEAIILHALHEFLDQGVDHSPRMWGLLMFGVWKIYGNIN